MAADTRKKPLPGPTDKRLSCMNCGMIFREDDQKLWQTHIKACSARARREDDPLEDYGNGWARTPGVVLKDGWKQ